MMEPGKEPLLRDRVNENFAGGRAFLVWMFVGIGLAAYSLYRLHVSEDAPKFLVVLALGFGGMVGAGIGAYAEFSTSRLAKFLALAGLVVFILEFLQ